MAQGYEVVIDDPPTMSLLGLLLGNMLERQVIKAEHQRRLARLRGDVLVEVGEMAITLRFGDGALTVLRGAREKPRARVRGSMDALLGIALGGSMVGPWLSGAIKTKGNLFLLLRMIPLLRVDG